MALGGPDPGGCGTGCVDLASSCASKEVSLDWYAACVPRYEMVTHLRDNPQSTPLKISLTMSLRFASVLAVGGRPDPEAYKPLMCGSTHR